MLSSEGRDTMNYELMVAYLKANESQAQANEPDRASTVDEVEWAALAAAIASQVNFNNLA